MRSAVAFLVAATAAIWYNIRGESSSDINTERKAEPDMKLLLTAFDPFGGEKTNPAQQAVGLIPANACGAEVVKLTVPTVFVRSVETVVNAIRSEKPDAVLMIGQAGGRSAVSVERVAININSASIADNEGNRPIEELIERDAPAAYFSTLPIVRIADAIKAEGVPAVISNTAGTFVCNQLMYGVLRYIEEEALPIRAGFIHIPFAPEQAARQSAPMPSMSIEDSARAIETAIRTLAGSE